MLERKVQSEILRLAEHFPVVGVVGPRQVGKTTLVKLIQKLLPKECVYFDLENPNDYAKFEQNPVWLLEQFNDYTVIIDEVQRMLEIFPILRAVIDQQREAGRFILLGSASPIFLAGSSESLAGRIAYLELTPLRLDECPETIDLNQRWHRGGFPQALLMPDDELWFDWQENFVRTYMDSDLRALGLNIRPMALARLLRIVGSINGSLLNYSDVAKSMDVSMPTVKNYIDYLEHAFIVRRLQPYFTSIGKRLVKSPKIYFRDTGNLHYLLNINTYPELVNHVIVGHSWEGFVVDQIIARLKKNVLPFFYRTQHGSEMDLVLVVGNEPLVSIEIKLSSSPKLSRGSHTAVVDLGTDHNFIISPTATEYTLENGWILTDLPGIFRHLVDLKLIK
jgi:hypothetical protein